MENRSETTKNKYRDKIQFRILNILCQNPDGLNKRQIEKALDGKPSYANLLEHLKQLEKSGEITVTQKKGQAGKQYTVKISEYGREKLELKSWREKTGYYSEIVESKYNKQLRDFSKTCQEFCGYLEGRGEFSLIHDADFRKRFPVFTDFKGAEGLARLFNLFRSLKLKSSKLYKGDVVIRFKK